MTARPQPSGVEMQILTVLWDRGPSTVREVLESLPDQKPRAYTTVLSTMQVMERKGFLVREGQVGGALVYKPAVTQRQVMRPLLRDMLSNLFGGKPSAVLQHLLEETPVDQEELDEIRRLLDAHSSTAPPAPPAPPPPAPGRRSRKGKDA